jgi:hypothetical protein
MKMDEIAKVIGQWMKFKKKLTPFREIAISSSSSIYLTFFLKANFTKFIYYLSSFLRFIHSFYLCKEVGATSFLGSSSSKLINYSFSRHVLKPPLYILEYF